MSTKIDDLIAPWSSNQFSMSNDSPFNDMNIEKLTMPASSSRYVDYGLPHDVLPPYHRVYSIADNDPRKIAPRVERQSASRGMFQVESVSFRYNHDMTSKYGGSSDNYYDLQSGGREVYNPRRQESVSPCSTENLQEQRNPYLDSSLKTQHNNPEVSENESYSQDNDPQYFDTYKTKNPNTTGEMKKSGNYNSRRSEYESSNNDYAPYRYEQKRGGYSESNPGAYTSYENKQKMDDRKQASVGTKKCKVIEIAPGQYMRLRGAEETWKAIQDDFYVPCSCVICELTLFCIQDATYVLCPQCQVVNPLEKIDGYDGGVGLGFTIEELAEWQNDILRNRRY
jgi:hypothetical protein